MEKYFWNSQIDYLKMTREKMWNDDYFEFLVKSVWKLNKPMNILDFGCGYGYLGMKLLPLLPEGSTYTGIDEGEELLCEAEKIFKDTPFHTEFINADLKKYVPSKQYDIAICQAVLRHIPHPEAILQKMVDSVVPSGMVICIEVNRPMEHAGLYLHDKEYDGFEKLLRLKKDWDRELQNGGRDYMLGIKVPIYMQKMGLKNVDVRINDFVNFVSPLSEDSEYKYHLEAILQTSVLGDEVKDIENNTFLLAARCLIISYGTK